MAKDGKKPNKKDGKKDGKKPSKGDQVTWRSHGATVEGTVEKEITEPTEAAGRKVAASPSEPQYEVRSAKTGRTAVHKPEALEKKQQKKKD